MKKILVVAAHPDDEILGCGATIAKEIENGAEVKVILAAMGVTSRYQEINEEVRSKVNQLYAEAKSANKAIGLPETSIIFGEFVDQQLDTYPFFEIVKFISNIVQQFRPDVVYTHHLGDYNLDHQIIFKAVLFACRPYFGENYPNQIYSFEVLSSTEWYWSQTDSFKPSVYVDINNYIQKKKRALE